MTYLSPLAYLLGTEGVALLRGIREGTADREFVQARIAEIRALLDDALLDGGVTAVPGAISSSEVYRDWAPTYDLPGNGLIDIEQPIVERILASLPLGTALDAACGTGRHAAYLASLGHKVIGVDESAEMLAHARLKLPTADLRQAGLDRIPLEDNSVDVVVCALALSHVRELAPVMAEFARVMRPGGHLVISDTHPMLALVRPTMARRPSPDGRPGILIEHQRSASQWLDVALSLGFQVRACEEPKRPSKPIEAARTVPATVSWELLCWCPEAANAAHTGLPVAFIWHFQLGEAERRE